MAESMVNGDNYLTIQGWMIADLGLKGNELIIYACIYGFSQAEGTWFTGSLRYLADWISGTRQTAHRCLQSLVAKGLLEKNDKDVSGVKFCEYRCKNDNRALSNSQRWCYQNDNGGVIKMITNNIENNIDTKYRENKDNKDASGAPAPNPGSSPEAKPKRKKSPQLTAQEIEILLERYTDDIAVLGLLREWVIIRKAKRAPETEKALTLNLYKLESLARESGLTVARYLEEVIMRGWAAFYPLRGNFERKAAIIPERSRLKTEAEHAAGGHQSGFGW